MVGTLITTLQYLLGLYDANGPAHFSEWWLSKGGRFSLMSYPIWLACILLFGGPVWFYAHRLNFRHWLVALSAGAVIPFVVLFAITTGFFSGRKGGSWTYYGSGGQQWVDGKITAFGWKMAAINSAEFALIGAIVALVIWAVAYRKESAQKIS